MCLRVLRDIASVQVCKYFEMNSVLHAAKITTVVQTTRKNYVPKIYFYLKFTITWVILKPENYYMAVGLRVECNLK